MNTLQQIYEQNYVEPSYPTIQRVLNRIPPEYNVTLHQFAEWLNFTFKQLDIYFKTTPREYTMEELEKKLRGWLIEALEEIVYSSDYTAAEREETLHEGITDEIIDEWLKPELPQMIQHIETFEVYKKTKEQTGIDFNF